jgi:hypothetical protein
MKKVVLILVSAVIPTALFSCKENTPQEVGNPSEEEQNNPKQELALASDSELKEDPPSEYRYVTALSGLSLREFDNLQSEKIAKMPYGTKVKVISSEGKQTMNVSGIKGAMDEVEFNHKKGFAFNGYLSKFFPPEKDITIKGYANELQEQFPEVTYTKTSSGTVSNPITSETLILPGAEWHEAFFTAHHLFEFPKEFEFPNPKGKDSEIIYDKEAKKGVWMCQLEITRRDDSLQKIEYVYTSEKFSAKVTIVPDGSNMKITRTEEIH